MNTYTDTPFENICDAFGVKAVHQTINTLVKIALSTDNIYFNTAIERENLLYFEELLHDCFDAADVP
jgi:hypothetical protein